MPRVGVIVLAAGRSSRFGRPDAHKLLALLRGEPLVRWSVRAALDAAIGDVVVVTGCEAPAIEAALAGLQVRTVREPAFAEGVATSLRRGVNAVCATTDAVVIGLGDQPTMRADAYRRVAESWQRPGASIVVPRYSGVVAPAHPVLFASETFRELLASRGDTGARDVITRDPSRVAVVDLDWPAPRDVDTSDDLSAVAAETQEIE